MSDSFTFAVDMFVVTLTDLLLMLLGKKSRYGSDSCKCAGNLISKCIDLEYYTVLQLGPMIFEVPLTERNSVSALL